MQELNILPPELIYDILEELTYLNWYKIKRGILGKRCQEIAASQTAKREWEAEHLCVYKSYWEGTLINETHWKDGKLHGPRTFWNDEGEMIKKEIWENDMIVFVGIWSENIPYHGYLYKEGFFGNSIETWRWYKEGKIQFERDTITNMCRQWNETEEKWEDLGQSCIILSEGERWVFLPLRSLSDLIGERNESEID